MTEPSEWAMQEASIVLERWRNFTGEGREIYIDLHRRIALALDAARRKAIEEAASVCVPFFTIPAVEAELDCVARKIFLAILDTPPPSQTLGAAEQEHQSHEESRHD